MPKLNILINAISIKEGGSLVVVKKLLSELSQQSKDIQWHLLVGKSDLLRQADFNSSVNIHVFSWINNSRLALFYWYEVELFSLIKNLKIDLVFSLTNYLPFRKIPVPSLLLVQHAGYFSSIFNNTIRQYQSFFTYIAWQLKKFWVFNSIKSASAVTVQTKALENEIKTKIKSKSAINVIPHGTGLVNHGSSKKITGKDPIIIGYVSKYGIQKDFQTVLKALQILLKRGIPVKLLLTLDDEQPEVKKILNSLQVKHLRKFIVNYGEVDQEKMQEIYNEIDIFCFPSLCESFGMPMTEAMASGLPVVAVDTPVNREVLDNAALYFSAKHTKELVNNIAYLINDPDEYFEYSKASLSRAKTFSWQQSASEIIKLIQQLLKTHLART